LPSVTRIYRKLEIHSRSELVRRIVRLEEGRDPAAALAEGEASS